MKEQVNSNVLQVEELRLVKAAGPPFSTDVLQGEVYPHAELKRDA